MTTVDKEIYDLIISVCSYLIPAFLLALGTVALLYVKAQGEIGQLKGLNKTLDLLSVAERLKHKEDF